MRKCPICDKGKMRFKKGTHIFLYNNQRLQLELTEYICDNCGESFFDQEEMTLVQPEIKSFIRGVNNDCYIFYGEDTWEEVKNVKN